MPIASFNTYQKARRFSPATIKRREVALRQWMRFIAPMGWDQASAAHADEFIASRASARTAHAYRSDLMCFYRWACQRGLVTRNPFADTGPVRVPKALPKPMPAELARIAIVTAPAFDVALALMLAMFAGLRRAEIAKLTADDLRDGKIVVREGKGRKDRTVPIHVELAAMLTRLELAGPVFNMTADSLGVRCNAHLARFGPYTMHCLRHLFATEFARVSNGNVPRLAELLGHANLETTMAYIKLMGGSDEILREMFQNGERGDRAA